MSLEIGQRVASYEITGLLGAGGMGEVYRAHDTRLKREVAIKVLPDEFSRDADRLDRFQREAEVLASLNHPNIASIYDLALSVQTRYLVLELVEGETLADRIAHGAMPVEEALDIAKHICEALEAAHEKGIIHRDLKPANVKITPDGKVKVLDFGLAKAIENAPSAVANSKSPTMLSMAATNAGMILGTAAYMSPEQAKGRQVDRRSDIFAFGCVVFEMLTGRPAFDGEDVTEILGRVVTAEPEWNRLPSATPWLIQRLLRRALTKDARQRLGDIRDARIEIEDALKERGLKPATTSPSRFGGFGWVVAGLMILALATLAFVHFREAPPGEIRVEVNTPSSNDPLSFAVSPDGRRLVFLASNEGKSQLFVRSPYRTNSTGGQQLTWLDRSGKNLATIGVPDTANLAHVELSPDGKRVLVQRTVNANTDLWLIDAIRGVPTRFTFDAAIDGWAVWSPDGSRVAFDSNRSGIYQLYSKSSSGAGTDESLLESDQTKGPNDWSSDGRFLLFRSLDPKTGWDLWTLPLFGDKKPFPFLKTPFEERDGQFSPDGKWIAYQSNESGRSEIYVQPFPGPGGKFQISSNGGAQVRWNKNGKEIFYLSLDSKMMATSVKLSTDGQSLETGTPVALFPVRIAGGPLFGAYKQQYDVSPDGQRFLVNLAADEGATTPITLIYNWKPKP
jgi:serine/threonine protein kinase